MVWGLLLLPLPEQRVSEEEKGTQGRGLVWRRPRFSLSLCSEYTVTEKWERLALPFNRLKGAERKEGKANRVLSQQNKGKKRAVGAGLRFGVG